jgi:phage-related protein
MPLVRKLKADLWEERIQLVSRVARVVFTVDDGTIVLLHAFIKKSQAMPQADLALTAVRLKQARS